MFGDCGLASAFTADSSRLPCHSSDLESLLNEYSKLGFSIIK
jgi:hypothetical protein